MSSDKKTLVFGATPNPGRTAFTAVHQLQDNGIEVVPVGIKKGEVGGLTIENDLSKKHENIHTLTLYLNPQRQVEYYDYFLGLQPERIIFNPGTENPELAQMAEERGIKTVMACTLTMLSFGSY